ncbi:glycerol kinase [Comamonas serinivorans]|uniref:Glycerol kinase n=1 Tax=Comamonas serinivorans TaxID=1082851 RepID=A0A1Y0EU97_9BURK|nr:glycerol kinase GlpK [Comamonas serinivorans]ARU06972.1 glycerol kinase [Comamonas serinivorans]
MPPRHLLALDQGTTSSRALVIDDQGQVQALAQREFPQHFPQSGWVEHDAMDIWRSQYAVAQEALAQWQAQARPGETRTLAQVAGIGIANQRETTVLWDRATGLPVAPAIVWQDRRTAPACEALRQAGHAARLQRRTGLVLDAYFSASKLAWLLAHVPGARQRAEAGELAFGTVDSWLIWRLTGGRAHVCDASNAARTLLFDIHRFAWDDGLLRLFDIPRAVLPRVVPSCGWVADTDAALFGIPLPIAGVAGDQQAALFGQACFAPGMAKNTYGTGCFMLMNTGDEPCRSTHRLLTTVAWQGPPEVAANKTYGLEGSVFMGGATIQWLRDGLGLIQRADEVQALAASVPDAGGVCMVPAFAGLGAPHWDPHARGLLVGLHRGSTRAHIARAALDGIAQQCADVFEAMALDAGTPVQELRVDGGASRNDVLMQLQADLLGVPVVRPRQTETTALGVAYLAGLATGVWTSGAAIAAQWGVARRFEPTVSEAERADRRAVWRDAMRRSRHWARADAAAP